MTSNYEWNKQMVEERLAARYREAEAHRLAQQAAGDGVARAGWWTGLWRWLTRAEAHVTPPHQSPTVADNPAAAPLPPAE